MEVSLGPGDFVLDADPAPLTKKGVESPLQFLAHVHCGWIKMALGTEVSLVPGHIVLKDEFLKMSVALGLVFVHLLSHHTVVWRGKEVCK